MPTYNRLTDRTLATGVTLNDLIHIVITGDTSQNPAGSSYKAKISQLVSLISGTTGTSGSAGTSGTNGSSGVNGSSGLNGTSGSSGINGTSGTNGSSGINGAVGSSGSSGISGSNGSSGIDGTSGSSGINGSNGSSGSSGINGTSGSSGLSGTNGTDGSSGSSGINGTLQQAYDNSTSPDILTSSILGAFSIKNGTGNSDVTTNLFEGIAATGELTSKITARGVFSGSQITTNGLIMGSVISGVTISATTSVTSPIISATTYQNLPSDVVIINSTQIQSGFTGGILFQSSASTVSQTTGFTWNNGRLGIGINSPVYDLDVNGSIYQRTGELLITSTGGVNKEGPFIASSGGDELSSDRKIQLGISDNSSVPVGINMFVTNNTFPPSYMKFRVNNADLVSMSGSSVIISGNTYTSGLTATSVTSPTVSATTISATTFNLAGSQIESSWTSYTPVWTASVTNPVIGNGTIEGYYKVIGKTCFVRGNIVMGSSTTFGSGEWYVSMPFTAANADAILLTATLLDNGSAWYNATMVGARAGFNTKAPIQYQTTGGTANDVNSIQPFTWASTDRFIWNGSYEIA